MDVADVLRRAARGADATLGERFGLSWDWFGRTSRPQNHELTHHFARRLQRRGLHSRSASTEQVYSVDDGRFLPDRYVDRHLSRTAATRGPAGDQCENCGKQLDPTDLIEPRSAISGSTDLEVRESNHLFLLPVGAGRAHPGLGRRRRTTGRP